MTPRVVRSPLVALAGYLVLSALAGILWWAWAPTPSQSFRIPDGSSTVIIPDETENQVAADGRYLLIVVVLALVVGIVAWRFRALRGPALPVAAAVAAFAGAEITRLVGSAMTSQSATVDSAFTPMLDVHGWAMVFAAPLLAALVVTALALVDSDPELGRIRSEQPAGLEHGGGGGDGAQLPHQFQFPPEDPSRGT